MRRMIQFALTNHGKFKRKQSNDKVLKNKQEPGRNGGRAVDSEGSLEGQVCSGIDEQHMSRLWG